MPKFNKFNQTLQKSEHQKQQNQFERIYDSVCYRYYE
jgi:hypothetical protein